LIATVDQLFQFCGKFSAQYVYGIFMFAQTRTQTATEGRFMQLGAPADEELNDILVYDNAPVSKFSHILRFRQSK